MLNDVNLRRVRETMVGLLDQYCAPVALVRGSARNRLSSKGLKVAPKVNEERRTGIYLEDTNFQQQAITRSTRGNLADYERVNIVK